ncbi:MAG TPA: hypothetical protein VFW04_16245 [Gemmatimonadaceae bacterium]|nr:hypothetical protein [Gemmatimonadaceae bacterium]
MSPRKHDHGISLDVAKQLVQNHHRTAPAGSERCGYFAREAFDEILAQPGCAGLRFYHGRDASGKATLVFIGVTGEHVDMLDGPVIENHLPCPPNCSGTTLGG